MGENSSTGTPIQLKFVTNIHNGSQKENVAFETNGLYYLKGDTTYLSFVENQDYGSVRTKVKIKDDEVLILRSGAVSMRHVYRNKEVTHGMYQNPAGNFEMVTRTNNIEYKWYNNSNKGKLFLAYSLQLQGESTGNYAITITFKEEEE